MADDQQADGRDKAQIAGKVAVAAALTTTLAAGPAVVDAVQLDEPVPIVQVLDLGADQPADQPSDEAPDQHVAVWKKVVKAIVGLLLALLVVAGTIFGALKGCAGSLGAPDTDSSEDATAQVQ